MNSHLDAVEARLAPLGYLTHHYAAPEISSQYLILAGPAWDDSLEASLGGDGESLDTLLHVTAVAGTPRGVDIMLTRVRDTLSPGRDWTRLPMAGAQVDLRFLRPEGDIGIDRDVTITGTNRNPAVGVITFQLVSEPTS